MYFSRKCIHCLICQTVTTSVGLVFYVYGPAIESRHDMTLYRESSIGGVPEDVLVIDGKQY